MHAGTQIDQWSLVAELSRGGNSVVWEAHNADGQAVAIKVLTTRNVSGESYRRFCDEVAVLRRIGARPGILPLLEAHTPESLSKTDRAWLAMPVAAPLRDALEGRRLEGTVGAVYEVAEVLSGLADEGIYHRDIKPNNLYWHQGRAVVGDFGLVDFPGKNDITHNARQVGPAHYIAPEMRDDPVAAAPGPADVYALAKTLWTLASGQQWPPMGQQRLEDVSACLRSRVDHERVAELDRLIEQSTSTDPIARPAMHEFAEELRAWTRDRVPTSLGPDLSEFAARISVAQEVASRHASRREEDIRAANKTIESFTERMRPVGEALRSIGASDGQASTYGDVALRYLNLPLVEKTHCAIRVHPIIGLPWLLVLFGVVLYNDRSLIAFSGDVLGLTVNERRVLRTDLSDPLPLGSGRVMVVLDELAARAISELPQAIAAYASALTL